MKRLTPLIPTLLSFGPLAMVMGLKNDGLFLPYVGALMMSMGMVWLFVAQQRASKQGEFTGKAGARGDAAPL